MLDPFPCCPLTFILSFSKVLELRIGRQDVGQTNPFASVPIQSQGNPHQDVDQHNQNQQNIQQFQHQQENRGHPNQMHNQANYQQPVQNTQSQSNHTDQGDDDDFPEDDDLSQFAVENANQDLIPVDDFPEDGMDDDDLLAAAVEEPETFGTSFSPTNVNLVHSNTPTGTSTSKPNLPIAIVSPAVTSPADKSRVAPLLENHPQTIGRDPWTYISLLLPILQAGQPFKTKVKVVSATLASKIALKKNSTGPMWSLSIVINDGTGSLNVPLSAALLDHYLGSAAAYTNAVKEEFKEKSKVLSRMLAGLSALLTLETLKAEPGSPFTTTVTAIEEVTGLHLAQMRKRRVVVSPSKAY